MKSTRQTAAEIEESLVSLFAGRPELHGFTVATEGGIVLSHVGIFPTPSADEARRICEEIQATLAEVVDERPEARALLAGRTFARSLH